MTFMRNRTHEALDSGYRSEYDIRMFVKMYMILHDPQKYFESCRKIRRIEQEVPMFIRRWLGLTPAFFDDMIVQRWISK